MQNPSQALEINCRQGTQDFNLFMNIVNQGIDSRLESFNESVFQLQPAENRINFCFHKNEIQILIRRLTEELEKSETFDFFDDEGSDDWIHKYCWLSDIIESTYDVELV